MGTKKCWINILSFPSEVLAAIFLQFNFRCISTLLRPVCKKFFGLAEKVLLGELTRSGQEMQRLFASVDRLNTSIESAPYANIGETNVFHLLEIVRELYFHHGYFMSSFQHLRDKTQSSFFAGALLDHMRRTVLLTQECYKYNANIEVFSVLELDLKIATLSLVKLQDRLLCFLQHMAQTTHVSNSNIHLRRSITLTNTHFSSLQHHETVVEHCCCVKEEKKQSIISFEADSNPKEEWFGSSKDSQALEKELEVVKKQNSQLQSTNRTISKKISEMKISLQQNQRQSLKTPSPTQEKGKVTDETVSVEFLKHKLRCLDASISSLKAEMAVFHASHTELMLIADLYFTENIVFICKF